MGELFRQVITIGRMGEMEGLQRKDGLDLRKFGKADINRTSEVEWDADKQKYFVKFRHAPEHPILTKALYAKVQGYLCKYDNEPIYFDEYEDGVKAEIKTLDYLRLQGLLSNVS